MVVLLPAPLGPMKPKTSPLPIDRFKSSTATNSPYRLVKWLTSIMNEDSPGRSGVRVPGSAAGPGPRSARGP